MAGAEDLLNEADALLPHGLPLRAYRVSPPPAAAAAGMRLAAVAPGAAGEPKLTVSIVPQRRETRRPIASVDGGSAAEGKRDGPDRSPTSAPAGSGGGGGGGGAGQHKFVLHGATLNPAGSEERDPLTFRIECLRVFLDAVMGEAAFMQVYRRIIENRSADASGDLSRTVSRALGRANKGLLVSNRPLPAAHRQPPTATLFTLALTRRQWYALTPIPHSPWSSSSSGPRSVPSATEGRGREGHGTEWAGVAGCCWK